MKKILVIMIVLSVFALTSALADSVTDTIMGIGTTQAFTDEAVDDGDLETILNAGLSAASAINQQPWFFAVVKNKEVMTEISGSGMGFTPPAGAGAPGGEKPEGGDMPKPEGADMLKPGGGMPGAGGAKAGLGDSPVAVIIYRNDASKSPNADFDCGLAAQNMVVAAASLGYGVKIVSSPTMSLNGANHDALCEKLGVDPSMQAVAVLLIGRAADATDALSSASVRDSLEAKTSIIE